MNRALLILPALTLALPLAAEISSKIIAQAAELTSQGTKALDTGDIAKAEQLYQQALKLVPDLPDAHLGLGHILLKAGKNAEALAEYELAQAGYAKIGAQIFALRSDSYQAVRKQVNSLQRQNNDLKAQTGATGTIVPMATQTIINRNDDTLRRLEAIQAPSATAVSEVPGEVFFHIGNARFRLNQVDGAIASWEQCAAKSPKFGAVQINLTVAYWKKGRFDDAKAHLDQAIAMGAPVNPKMKADLEKAAAAAPKP
jgi:tetratricopeptide (TPR) repeat protein